jgi:hypothetical protein
MTPRADLAPLLAAARELYGRVVYSHKTHEKEREICTRRVRLMTRINITLTGLTTFLAILTAAIPATAALIATAVSATATVCFVVWQSSADPAGQESRNRVIGKELLWIREQFLLFVADCHGTMPPDQLQRRLEMLTRELTAVYKFSPDTSPEAYAAADKMLKSGHFTFSDDEIDSFLPAELLKKKP